VKAQERIDGRLGSAPKNIRTNTSNASPVSVTRSRPASCSPARKRFTSGRVVSRPLMPRMRPSSGLVVTFLANVPLNDELAAVDLTASPDVLAQAGKIYEAPWDAWNAVRAVARTAALGCLAWTCAHGASRRPEHQVTDAPPARG
jgi:hypothetical protein